MAKRSNVKFAHRPRRPSQTLSEHSETVSDGVNHTKNGEAVRPVEPSDFEKKTQTFITRAIYSIAMISGFAGAILAGHIYLIMLITTIQIISFKEVISIIDVPSKARSLRFTKSLNWYFLGTTMYFLYGESMIYYFKHVVLVDKVLSPFATHHRFISFMLYICGFIFFVTSLQKGHYKFQFTQFAWTHCALYFIVVQAHFVMNNIFEGMIWLLLPASLVICNDIFAYICGITFGRTQLIKISPKKTVEGFVGAWIFTIIFGFAFGNWLAQYKYFICPVNDLGATFFSGLDCQINPAFVKAQHQLPFDFPVWSRLPQTINIAPYQIHILFLASFASLVAPFGGFFASGIKRTFKIKDFGHSIPGHGGMTDRMDCQFIMGTLMFMYYQGFIATHKASVGAVIEMAITGLTPDQQLDVIRRLSTHLMNQGILSASVVDYLHKQTLSLKSR